MVFIMTFYKFNDTFYEMTPYKCADEGKPCYFRLGTQRNIVIYGRPLAWAIKTIDHAIVHECTNDAMGCDPIEGFGKACYLIPWKWIQDATRRRLAGFEGEELDSLNTEEADNLIDEWLDELNADNPSEQNEETLSEIEQDEVDVDDIADSRLYLAVGFPCDNRFNCFSGCCENGKCVSKKKDWFHVSYCPAECRGSAFGS